LIIVEPGVSTGREAGQHDVECLALGGVLCGTLRRGEGQPAHQQVHLVDRHVWTDRAGPLGSPQQCYEQLQPYWKEFGVNHLVIRTHWAGMPLSTALASMRLISDELLPELRKA